jgi:uncharacterized protein
MSEDKTSGGNPPHDYMRYDLRVQEALRGVMRKVLQDTERQGVKGAHHFFITFKTHLRGVEISDGLKEKYPDEITIVLQHQFWNLKVSEKGFQVRLSFSGKEEKLVVPFEAVVGFFDPSVQFGLKFEVSDPEAPFIRDLGSEVTQFPTKARSRKKEDGTIKIIPSVPHDLNASTQDSTPSADIQQLDSSAKVSTQVYDNSDLKPVKPKLAAAKTTKKKNKTDAQDGLNVSDKDLENALHKVSDQEPTKPEKNTKKPTENVVSLDAFRKKT